MRQAAALYGDVGLPFDRARTLLSLGRAQRRQKRWADARTVLRDAAAAFDEIGSTGWAIAARSELARVAGRKPGLPSDLTPSERRVADLAAEGRSNKEIAQALFVSVDTVETHLSHVYAKLGVESRIQLSRRLAQADGLAAD
jgi:DNA-binding CsgD family transcriptional regulator